MTKKKLKVALIFGGTSQEREVSLESGKTVAHYLNKSKYDLIPVEISSDGKWLISSGTIKQIEADTKTQKVPSNRAVVPIDPGSVSKVDVAFLALHGPGGEDGTIQGILESLGIKYTGSGVLASALAMDKAKTKRMVASEGILVAPHIILTKSEYKKNPKKYISKLHGKIVIKPNQIGSSIGVTISADKNEIKKGIKSAFKHDSSVIIEPFIKGREFTVPILGNNNPEALPVNEIVPAPIDKALASQLQQIALDVHILLGCRGVTRSDFIVTEKGQIYFLEINTIPGMTENSLVPKAARVVGMSYTQLLDKLIDLALDKKVKIL